MYQSDSACDVVLRGSWYPHRVQIEQRHIRVRDVDGMK